jgi:hypothetical protein
MTRTLLVNEVELENVGAMAAPCEVEARDSRRDIRTYSRTLPTVLRTRVQISADFDTVLSRVAKTEPARFVDAVVPPLRAMRQEWVAGGHRVDHVDGIRVWWASVLAGILARNIDEVRSTLLPLHDACHSPRQQRLCTSHAVASASVLLLRLYAAVAPDDSLLCRMDRSDAVSTKTGELLAVHSADDADALIHTILRGRPCETDAIVRYGREPLTPTDVFNFTALIEGSASAVVWRSLLLRAAALFVEQAAAPRLIALVRAHCRPARFPEGSTLSVDKNP